MASKAENWPQHSKLWSELPQIFGASFQYQWKILAIDQNYQMEHRITILAKTYIKLSLYNK